MLHEDVAQNAPVVESEIGVAQEYSYNDMSEAKVMGEAHDVPNEPAPNNETASEQDPFSLEANDTELQDSSSLDDDVKRDDAWKYCGYPELSRWMASSNDFFLLRKFSRVAARSLLYLEFEIAELEGRLEAYDQRMMDLPKTNPKARNDSFKLDKGTQRESILRELRPLLREYYDLVNQFAQVRSRPVAKGYQIRNIRRWEENHQYAILDAERHMFEPIREGDLFPIANKIKTPLWLVLEPIQNIRKLFKDRRPRAERANPRTTRYMNETLFEIFISLFIVFTGLALLYGPLWWLNYVSDEEYRLAIITVAVTIFASWLWMAAGPGRSFEVLAGSAAYAAVLMVYLQVGRQ